MRSDSVKNMSAYADQNHAPSFTDVRLEFRKYRLVKTISACGFNLRAALISNDMFKCLNSFILAGFPATTLQTLLDAT